MSITLTEKAVTEVKRAFEQSQVEPQSFLRVGITGGGCHGFNYDFRPDQQFNAESDTKLNFHGLEVVVDRKSALYLDGTVIDFHEGLDRRGFTFNNPNAVKTCGCGSSFQA